MPKKHANAKPSSINNQSLKKTQAHASGDYKKNIGQFNTIFCSATPAPAGDGDEHPLDEALRYNGSRRQLDRLLGHEEADQLRAFKKKQLQNPVSMPLSRRHALIQALYFQGSLGLISPPAHARTPAAGWLWSTPL